MDHKRQAATIERQCSIRQSRSDKRMQARLADYAYRQLLNRYSVDTPVSHN